MTARLSRRRVVSDNTWPGFVDALSSLLLVIIFLLSVFLLAQFFLGQALSGRDEALEKLSDQVAELGNLLRLERQAGTEMRLSIGQLSASLRSANLDRDDMTGRIAGLERQLEDAEMRLGRARDSGEDTANALTDLRARYATTFDQLAAERSEVTRLNAGIAALRQQLARIAAALEISEAKDLENQVVIADLGKRLNVALAAKVEELAGYRSEFYGRLKALLGEREDIHIAGDRFVFQSELLFASGSADLGAAGQEEMRRLAATLMQIAGEIPLDIDWILRIDGHTDPVPISTGRFPSNWELSTQRAISVVRFLIAEGVPPDRLAATGFGEFQPLVPGASPEAYRRNRRIEMRFTQR